MSGGAAGAVSGAAVGAAVGVWFFGVGAGPAALVGAIGGATVGSIAGAWSAWNSPTFTNGASNGVLPGVVGGAVGGGSLVAGAATGFAGSLLVWAQGLFGTTTTIVTTGSTALLTRYQRELAEAQRHLAYYSQQLEHLEELGMRSPIVEERLAVLDYRHFWSGALCIVRLGCVDHGRSIAAIDVS